jgi:aspartate aminotransferase-like enzyme
MPFAFDEWGVDVAVTASQKCLMSSPGLAFVVLSERAWAASASAKLPRNYWNFAAIRNETTKTRPETPGTAPVHLVLQVAEAVRMIHEEGLAAVFDRHATMAAVARASAARLGLAPLFPELRNLSPTLTALALPADVDPQAVRDEMKRHGVLVAAGLGATKSRGFRIGHMGDIRVADVERTMAALAMALSAERL